QTACPAGKKCPTNNTTCNLPVDCPAGTYQNKTGQTECINCACNKYQDLTGQTSCKAVTTGYYPAAVNAKKETVHVTTAATTQVICPAGKKCPVNNATDKCNIPVDCPVGQYQDETGKTTCKNCSAGTYQNETGKTSCKNCSAGTYQNKTGQTECIDCACNKYQNEEGKATCKTVTSGYYPAAVNAKKETVHVLTAATTQVACPAGKKCPANNAIDKCNIPVDCPAGQYQDETGKTTCKNCSAGTYQNETGKTSCKNCSVGTYQNETGKTSCKNCDADSYQDETGKTSCKNCPSNSGTWTSATNKKTAATAISECKCNGGYATLRDNGNTYDGGDFSATKNPSAAGSNKMECKPTMCATYSPAGNNRRIYCGEGLENVVWASLNSGTAIKNVASPVTQTLKDLKNNATYKEDKYSAWVYAPYMSDEASDCHYKGAANVFTETGNYHCGITTCPANAVPDASTGYTSCKCIAGYYGNGSTCIPCPKNSYKDYVGNAESCSSCPSNSTTNNVEGATSITQCFCPAGYYGNNLDSNNNLTAKSTCTVTLCAHYSAATENIQHYCSNESVSIAKDKVYAPAGSSSSAACGTRTSTQRFTDGNQQNHCGVTECTGNYIPDSAEYKLPGYDYARTYTSCKCNLSCPGQAVPDSSCQSCVCNITCPENHIANSNCECVFSCPAGKYRLKNFSLPEGTKLYNGTGNSAKEVAVTSVYITRGSGNNNMAKVNWKVGTANKNSTFNSSGNASGLYIYDSSVVYTSGTNKGKCKNNCRRQINTSDFIWAWSTSCANCPCGMMSNAGAKSCTACAATQFAPEGSSSCSNPRSGYKVSGNKCKQVVDCAAISMCGYYNHAGVNICRTGWLYNKDNNSDECGCYSSDSTVYINYCKNKHSQSSFYMSGTAPAPSSKSYNCTYKLKDNDPVILDLKGDGIKLTSVYEGVMFDIDASGEKKMVAWTEEQSEFDDAFLCLDKNGNGVIDDGSELFGDQQGAETGLDELAKYDDNKDGIVDEKDAIHSKLLLWADMNKDGISQPEELKHIKDLNITEISTDYQTEFDDDGNVKTDENGNQVGITGTFKQILDTGETIIGKLVDVFLKTLEVIQDFFTGLFE
ncbi:MAG: hypothetical protein K6A44_05215, partial [bacterium]|nr:hypothetical protein [bacterium]